MYSSTSRQPPPHPPLPALAVLAPAATTVRTGSSLFVTVWSHTLCRKFMLPLGTAEGVLQTPSRRLLRCLCYMSNERHRIQATVAQLAKQLPASLASPEAIDAHLRRLIIDYGLPAETARHAAKTYFTKSREGMAARLVTELEAANTEKPTPSCRQLVGDLELLSRWEVPLEDAHDIVYRAHIDEEVSGPSSRSPPHEATDEEVADAVPTLDDPDFSPPTRDPAGDDESSIDSGQDQ